MPGSDDRDIRDPSVTPLAPQGGRGELVRVVRRIPGRRSVGWPSVRHTDPRT